MKYEEQQERLHEALIQAFADNCPLGFEGSVVTKWAAGIEWMKPDGEKWMSKINSPTATVWEAKGLWHECLYGDWASEESG